jgi:hypothetical protein
MIVEVLNWTHENGLALYGAVVGTAAFAMSFMAHRHSVKIDSIQLTLSVAPHPQQQQHVLDLQATPAAQPWDQLNIAEVYTVTVRNIGSIPAPLESVGIITATGDEITAAVSNNCMLTNVKDSNCRILAPRSSQTFSIYLKRGQTLFSPVKVFAIDQTGKRWKARA